MENFMLQIIRMAKFQFEEFLFTFRVHQLVALDMVSSSQPRTTAYKTAHISRGG